jgi:endonuclease G, mitochondrial
MRLRYLPKKHLPMNLRKIPIYAMLLITVIAAGCKKNSVNDIPPVGTDTPAPKPYTIVETFESANKTAYAAADVTLPTGSWKFDDALIGNLAADVKNDTKSVRLRTGSLSMNFDLTGVTQIQIKHAKYGADAASTWQLSMSADGGSTYTPLGDPVNENNTTLKTDSFAVVATTKIRFKISKTGTTRINIDDITFKGKGDPGLIAGTPDVPAGPDTTQTGTPSGARGVIVGSDAPPTSGDNSNMLFGNPSDAQPVMAMMNNYLIDMGYYVESYNATKGVPNWVSWHLDATNTTNATARLDNFAAFNGLPSGWFSVQSNSYNFNTYGFDRGHNCPSADRTSSVNANSATFLMTNMIPQAPQNNQQTWNNLESYLRAQVVQGNEVYIIMGSYGTGGTGAKGPFNAISSGTGTINVPSNVWKVAVIIPAANSDVSRVSSSTRVIAVNTPNINTISTDWKQYIVSVRDIETATGYNLLSNLSQSIQDAVETKKDPGN